MKKFSGILFATDLDGTLLRYDKTISDENRRAIEYFVSEGGIFTFITGRISAATTHILNQLRPNAPIGCVNGGSIYDYTNKKLLWKISLDKSVLEMAEYVNKNLPPMGIEIITHTNIYFYKKSSATEKHKKDEKLPDLIWQECEPAEPIAKILFADENEKNIEKLMQLLKTHPRAEEFDFVRSDPNYYEIMPKGINKGFALEKLADILGIDIRKTIAAGDNENDAAMLAAAGAGFAVANASQEAIDAADFVTVSNEEHAIAKIIEKLDKTGINSFFNIK